MDYQNEVDQIFRLCEKWMNQVIQPDGSGHHDADSDIYNLYNNVKLHELSLNEIQACCAGVTDKLHYRHAGAFISRDHLVFWSWIGQLFCNPYFKDITSLNSDAYDHLCHIIIPMVLSGNDILFDIPLDENNKKIEGYDFHLREFIGKKWTILKYLSYPLLESTTKSLCANYINNDGEVIRQFSVIQQNGHTRNYNIGNRCSSLRDSLFLLEDTVAGEELIFFLNKIKHTISRITSEPNVYDTLYSWRNQILHGNRFFGIVGCLLFNIAVLLLLEMTRNDYEILKEKALDEYKESIADPGGLRQTYYKT